MPDEPVHDESAPSDRGDDETTADETTADEPQESHAGPMFSGYGVASAALGLVCVAAVVLAYLIWAQHRDRMNALNHQLQAAQTAVEWTGVLINMNKDNVDSSLSKLHDGTVGELNTDFDAAMKPYRDVVLALQARSSGQINSVSIETVHHNPDAQPGEPPPKPDLPPELASRTDTVLIVATSVSENAGDNGKPQMVRWNLRIGVSDVGGKPLISHLEPIR